MSQIIQNLNEVIGKYDAVFCDVWGVVHNGKKAFVDAVEALMQARMQDVYVALVTNSPKTPARVLEQLKRMEIPETAFDNIITAGQAMQYSLFATNYKYFYFIGSKADECAYLEPPEEVIVKMKRTEDYKRAEVVLCAGLDYGHKDQVDDYALELRQAHSRGLKLYCGNPDVVVDHGEDRIWCAGALAAFYADLGGEVYQFGKPFPPIYQLARDQMQMSLARDISPSRILFVGDGVETDLKGAMLEDMDALFVSGGLAAQETGSQEGQPDPERLDQYLSEHQLDPNYTIGKLRW